MKLINRKKKLISSSKHQYLSGHGVILDSSELCESFIETQITDKKTAENYDSSHIKLTFGEDNLLQEANQYSNGTLEDTPESLKIGLGKLLHKERRINEPFNFIPSPNGNHKLGGVPPEDFNIPVNKCPGSFQYLGLISRKDPTFNWLPFDIKLICPIYMNFDKIWIDYSDANSPVILNPDEVNSLSTDFDEILKPDSYIQFEEWPFKTKITKERGNGLGCTGVPFWFKTPDIPRCPKSNRTMRFLCQLFAGEEYLVEVEDSSIDYIDIEEHPELCYALEDMNFRGDGNLTIFIEPSTKIACYLIDSI